MPNIVAVVLTEEIVRKLQVRATKVSGYYWPYKTGLPPPLFIDERVPSRHADVRSCISVLAYW
jgi:hypothetical protein